jgi:hypothetical protein
LLPPGGGHLRFPSWPRACDDGLSSGPRAGVLRGGPPDVLRLLGIRLRQRRGRLRQLRPQRGLCLPRLPRGRRWAAPLLSVLLSSLLISASLSFSSSPALLISFSPLPSAASAEPLFVEAPRGAPCPGWCCAVVVGGAFHRAWEGTRLWASARSAGGEIRGGCGGHAGVRRFRAGLACGRL